MKKGFVALAFVSLFSLTTALSGCHAMWEGGASERGLNHHARIECAKKCEHKDCKARCDDKFRVVKYDGGQYAMGTRYAAMFGGY